MTTLTYVLATENGQFNSTITWGHLHACLMLYARYKAVTFVRINDWSRASFRIVNAKSLAAWATYSLKHQIMRLHPTVNYGNNPTTLAKVINHECGHFRNAGHHNNRAGLMHTTAGDALNWAQIDDPWWSHRPWRSSLRPWHEPYYFRDVFANPRIVSMLGDAEPTIATEDAQIKFGCPNWWQDRFSRQPKIHSVAEVSRSDEKLLREVQYQVSNP